MKIRKIFIILILFSILAVMSLPVFATNSSNLPKNFHSNGDLIKGWYWLRDNSLQNYAQWTFENIPPGENDLTLEITALATDRPNGRKGLPAEFLLIYEVPGGNVFVTQKVTLPNVSQPNDSVGYTCNGQVTIPRLVLQEASVLFVRTERILPDTNHLAFNKKSIKIIETVEVETYPPSQETQFYQGSQLPDTNTQNEAFLIQPGIYHGSLGGQTAGDQIDREDWYSLNLQEGQIINLQLTQPSGGSFIIYLRKPGSTSTVGYTISQDNIRTLQHVANISGIWFIKIRRSSGEGNYQLSVDIQNQNDAGSNHDAGDTSDGAIALYPGTFNGFLNRADKNDWYSINPQKGQIINLQLTMPSNASFGLYLYKPKGGSASVGSSQLQDNIRTLQHVANISGIWFIKIRRSSGEGNYQLSVDIQNQNDAGSNQDAGNTSDEAIEIYTGRFTGFLKKADNDDWYKIYLQEGQTINLRLAYPSDARIGPFLYRPNSIYSEGIVHTQDNIKTLQHDVEISGIWHIKIHRSSGEGDYQLSINISGYPSGQTGQSQSVSSQEFTANKFSCNGSLIQGWYWLRDSALKNYAEWTFENIPPGNSDLTLDITSLATNQAGGGSGFPARFRLIFGFPGSGSMGGVFQTTEITLPNISPPNDPVGYTCHGLITIPRDFIAGATTFFFRVERISPNDNHIAFNRDSITLFTGEQITGAYEIQSSDTRKK